MQTTEKMKQLFAPNGQLTVSINLGNPILAKAGQNGGPPSGVSVDLARAFARELGVGIELIEFASAGESVAAVTAEQADIGFFAIDPVRGQGIRFSAAYVLITGSYLVAEHSPIQAMSEVDHMANRVVVGKGSAYDLFLTRELNEAGILRAPTSPTVVDVFVEQGCEVAAGVTQQLEADLLRYPGLRILPGHFMVIQQAMGVAVGRGEAAAAYLAQFVERMKRSGFVAEALQRHGIQGAAVAPLTGE